MPIGLEQWRAQISLSYASRMPRVLVASKGRKYRQIHWALQLLYLCLASVQLLFQTINTGQKKWRKIVREWKAQLSTSSVFQHLPMYGNGEKKGLSLLATCLIVVQILLLIAGDVERNPGPLTGQASRLEVGNLVTVQDELVNLTSKWREIGLGLGFHPGTLDEIQLQRSDPSPCLQEMLERWIKTVNPPPTWEGLVKALERPTVGERQKAQQLREKYLKSEESEHDEHRVMVSDKETLEYHTISKQFSTIVDALSTSVDPASFAQKLHEADVITADVVERANVTGGPTPSQRIYPIIQAVRTHVGLKASKYHDFITVLQDTCPTLAKMLQKFFTTDLELNAPTVLSEVTDWEVLGRHLNVNPGKLNEIQRTGTNPQHCKEKLMKEWVKTDPRASWQKLSRSLDEMGEQEVSKTVKGTYINVSGQGSMAASKKTHEYHTISKHLSTIVDALSTLVDPANFAHKLHEAEVITANVVERASVTGGTTPTERINSIIRAVRTHVCLMATKYHDFITVLQDACPTLAEVLQKYFNTDLELHSPIVLSEVSNWKSLGKNLGVDPGKLNELEQSGSDLQHCKEELVKEWVKTDPTASWQKLSRSLDQMGEQEVAERIRGTYIKESVQEVASDECPEQQKHDVEVLREIRSFESRFDVLTFAIRKEMEEAHVPPERFQHSLTLLPESIRPEHLQFLENKLSDISRAENIGKLFMHLNLYWNFFDYALLEHIIERFGSNQLKKQMVKYGHDLAQFRRTTTLGQFIKFLPGRAEPPPHFSEVKSHLTKNVMEYTLEELEQLRRDICFEYRFKPFMLMIARVKQSSIIIVWHIPSVLVSELSDAILDTHSSFFRYHGIVKMEVDGLCVLNRKGEVQDDESKNRVQMQQELQVDVQKSADERVEFDAALQQKDAQLDWERRERQTLEEQFKRKLQLNRKEVCELREEKEKLLAAMRVQSDHERKEKETLIDQIKLEREHQQQRIKLFEASLHRVTEQLAQEVELKQKQEQKERERKAQVDSEVRQRAAAEQQLKLERELQQQRVKELEEKLHGARKEKEELAQKLSLTTAPKQESQLTGLGAKLLDPMETAEHQPKPKMEQQRALLEKKQLTESIHEKARGPFLQVRVDQRQSDTFGAQQRGAEHQTMSRGVCFSFRESGRCSYGNRCIYSHDISLQTEGAGITMQAQAKKNRRICSLELPPKLNDWIIRKDSYSALRKCREVTGASVRYNKEERKLEISADDNAKCERAKEWIHVNIFIEATEEKWKFYETCAGPRIEIEFEQVPPDIRKQLPVPRDHQNYFYMKLAGPEDLKAQPGRLKTSIYHKEGAGGIEEIKRRMKEVLGSFEQQQQYYIVGIEARFGRIIWDLPEDVVVACPQWRLGDFQENIRINGVALRTHFYTEITSDMEVLQHAGVCSPPKPPKQFINIALLFGASRSARPVKYRMVVEEKTPGHFVLLNLYHPSQKTPKIDYVRLGKNHDIRLAFHCSAAMDPDNHHDRELFQVAERVVKTIQRTPDGKLQMVAKGDNYTVDFLRDKKQTQYPLRDNPNWVIAKYELKEFCMGDDDQSWTVNSPGIAHFQNEKVELELWKEKYFGDRATRDTVTEEYCHNVRTTKWTTKDVVADMEGFIKAAGNIAEYLT